jgi:branched-chain amino acid transport system permease protein
MTNSQSSEILNAVKLGLISGVVTLSLSIIGLVALFGDRYLVSNLLTMGQVLIFVTPILISYYATRSSDGQSSLSRIISGLIIGAITGLFLLVLIYLDGRFNVRSYLINVSPALIDLLSFGRADITGGLINVVVMMVVSALAVAFHFLSNDIQGPLLNGLVYTLTIGLFSDVLSERIRSFFGVGVTGFMFQSKALRPVVALVLFILIAGLTVWRQRTGGFRERINQYPPKRQLQIQRGSLVLLGVLFLILPLLLGSYLTEVINNVGIYVLMGLGLNIVVGFAGLLDLGYVAFFAIGAYTMGVLTSGGSLGISGISFWAAVPIAVIVSVFAGILLGVPVLRMRGDYLAIVTLGFGEIIGKFAISDMLKPFIGGAQGLLQIPKPSFFGTPLIQPGQFYYIVLVGCLIAAFVSWRLSEARLGRQWMALREDEDVAEAMGINLVSTKLLAFAIGAAFSGLSGAIFASKLTSIFPHSFNLLISINVLSLIIVGGLGSLPGVIVGSLILVGLPEILREFAEFRLLMYGAVLVVMMLAKPDGFVPSAVRRREIQADEEAMASSTVAAAD